MSASLDGANPPQTAAPASNDDPCSLRIAVMPGSVRRGSINQRLATVIAPVIAERAVPHTAAVIDLADYDMPIYNGDMESDHGQPEAAVRLREYLRDFDGLVIVAPEYNGGPSALLKNTIDWVSRVDRQAFSPLAIGLAAATPGPRGGVNGLEVMRRIGEHMRLAVLPTPLGVANAPATLGGPGEPIEQATADQIERWVTEYLEFVQTTKSALVGTQHAGAAV